MTKHGAPMEFDYELNSQSFPYINSFHHGFSWRLPLMAPSSKPLNPSAPPFLPTAAPPPPPPPALPLWHYDPHDLYRRFRVGGLGEKVVAGKSSGAPFGVRSRVRGLVPPRLMFRARHEPARRGPESRKRWVPRDSKNCDDNGTVTLIEDAAADHKGDEDDGADNAEPSWLCGVTAVMMRNIPNLLKRWELLEILDEHCREANRGHAQLPRSEYDFVYLPIDYERKLNKGYAFVNFTSADAAVRMGRAFHGMKWEGFKLKDSITFRTKKVCEICPAATQGKAKLEVLFRSRVFPSEEYQPLAAVADPRDGVNGAPLHPVGKLSSA
ncbi:hypothetical protein CDL15_Pgr003869 [Punica granatum]|uniref:Mei2-like C-terminal RNA recognition motif domain-containing protein n=1 Tax=Punica granatum TaxID=22663 RepID=A0A218XTV2_PUNGR|nr:hypothetical protein CDL15_Pgr003869 [Punica granatum]